MMQAFFLSSPWTLVPLVNSSLCGSCFSKWEALFTVCH
jgi:hypothetical protein